MTSRRFFNFLISGITLWAIAIVSYAMAATFALPNTPILSVSLNNTPQVIYVDQNVSGGTGDGSSWENAMPELADALQYARTQYDADNTVYDAVPLQIYVAKGTYKPLYNAADSVYTTDGGRDNAFVMVKNVHIYGGFDPANNITELTHNRILPDENTSVVDGTILSGDIGTLNDESDNAYHVVFFSGEVGSALLNGVSITQGKANGTGNIIVNGHKIYRDSGGGIYNCYSSPALTHISISDNSARTGGGISNSYSDPTLAHVGISGNIARYGGGIYNSDSDPTLTHVSISGNNGYSGGGLYNAFSTPLLTHVNVSANTASEEGGGIYNEISSPKLTYVNIRNNTAKWGGGMSNNVILMHNYTPSSPILKHVRITGNTADYGGGMSNLGSHPVLVNVIISENSGSAICNDFNSNPVLINVSITANMGGDKSGGIVNYMASSPRVYNSIIYGNGTTSVYNNVDQYNEAIPQFYNSWIEGSGGSTAWDTTFGTDGGNNLDATSLPFTDAANGDYSLAPGSPAIDGGNRQYWLARGSITGNETDLAGNPRIVGANIDMGAYEDQTLTISPDASNILYVDRNVINPYGDGSSWESALPELADALQYARIQYNVDTTVYDATPLQIYVAKGTYKPLYNAADNSYTTYGGRDNSFVMVKNVQIYGGFDPANHITDLTHNRILPDENTSDGRTLSAVEGTILSGDISTHNNYAYHVVISSGDVGSALLNGVIITDGNANGSSSVITVNGNNTVRRNSGGGIYNFSSSPALTHVNITNNTANFGGGMFNESSPSPVLTRVNISNNTADHGGGMYNYTSSSPILTNVSIMNNRANYGGGMHNYASSPVLTNVNITDNRAHGGGGMNNSYSSSPQVYNSIVYRNTALMADNVRNNGSTPQFYNSLIKGSGGSTAWDTAFGTDNGNNLDATTSPFTDAAGGDYSLAPGSPAINGGNNQYWIDQMGDLTGDETDLAGNPRIIGGSIDMGAYESTYENVVSVQGQVDITVPYGTVLDDLVLPSTHAVETTLSNGNVLPADIDPNSTNWTYVSGGDGQGYDALRAGSYIFHAKLVAPDISSPDWYSNTQQLKVEIQITVEKGTPQLSSAWNGASIDTGIGIALTYGDEGALGISHNNTDLLDDDADIALIAGDGVLNLANLDEVQTLMSGTGRLRISLPETDNFEETVLEFDVRVAPKVLTITAVDQQKTYGEPLLPDGTAFTVDGLLPMDEVATVSLVSDGFDAQADAGTYTIFASAAQGAGLENYSISYEEGTLTNAPKTLTITANDRSKVYGEDLVLGITEFAATGLINGDAVSAVTLASDGATASALADNYAIVASAAQGTGLTNYTINYEEGTLTVAKGTPQLSSTWNSAPIDAGIGIALTYGDEGALGISHNNSDIGVEAAIALIAGDGVLNVADLQEVQTLMSGTGRLRISVPETDNFEEAVLEFEVRVAPKALTITAVDQQKTYGEQLLPDGTEFTVDGLLPWDEIATVSVVSDGLDAQADAGTYIIVTSAAQGTGLANYNISYVDGILTVDQKALAITANDRNKVYGEDLVLGITEFAATGLVNGDAVSAVTLASDGAAASALAGDYAIVASAARGTGLTNYMIKYEEGILTVAKGTPQLSSTWNSAPIDAGIGIALTYGDEGALGISHNNSDIGVEADIALIAGDGVLNVADLQEVQTLMSGTGRLRISVPETDNFEEAVLEFEVRVAPKALTITAVDQQKTYGEQLLPDGTEFTVDGLLPWDEIATVSVVSDGLDAQADAGTYTIVASAAQGTGLANYNISYVDAALTVVPKALTIAADAKSKVYGSNDPALTYQLSTPLLPGDSFTGALVRATGENVGEYVIEQGDLAAGKNYSLSFVPAVFRIAPATITGVTFSDASFVYDGTAKSLAINGTLPTGTDVTYSNNDRTDVGVQQVTATISGSNYYELVLTAELEITPATITGVTLDNASFVYDGTAKSLAINGTLPAGTEVIYSNNSRTDIGIQQVTATVSGSNYQELVLTAELEITPATITGITFDNASFVYDGTAKSLAISGTLPSGTEVVYSNNSRTDVGVQEVTATISGSNYQDLVLTAELEITKATITGVTFDDASFVYDGTAKSLAISGTLPVGTEVVYNNNNRTNAGTQQVTATISGSNYQELVLSAQLEVTKAPQVISFSSPGTLARDARTVPLEVVSSSGLPVSLSIDDLEIAQLDGHDLIVKRLGTVHLTATQVGNNNYLPAEPVVHIIRIGADAGSKLPIRVHQAVSPNGDGINDYLMIEGIADYPENRVTIFDKSGKILAEIESYNNRERAFTGEYVRDGTYYYYLDVKDGNTWKREKGFFVVRR